MHVKKIDFHAAHGEKRATLGRLLMCGLIFGMLLSAIPAGVAAIEVVTFNDRNLEAAVRDALGKPTGDITDADMAGLTRLDASGREISDLSGLEHAVNLGFLNLRHNQISDIGALAGLKNLWLLALDNNRIRNIGPLTGLTNLQYLGLNYNQISDIIPLVRNSGLGSGDSVWLEHNYLDLTSGSDDMVNIQALIDRGVQVDYRQQDPVPTYTLDLTVNPEDGGTVTGAGPHSAGSTVSVTATPAEGYTFVRWTDADGSTVSTEANFGYTMPEGDTTLTANFERKFEVQWLPPVTNRGFMLQGGSTLPLKFQLVDGSGAVVREVQEGISLKIADVATWVLGKGKNALRFDDGQYIANFHTRDYGNPGDKLTATVYDAGGSELGSITFEVSMKNGADTGNR